MRKPSSPALGRVVPQDDFPSGKTPAGLRILGLTCFCLFLGRAWQHLFGDAPFRALFWKQAWLEPWVGRYLRMSWEAYVSHPGTDALIGGMIQGSGVLYAVCALIAVSRGRWRAWKSVVMGAGAVFLFLLSLLYGMEGFWRAGELLEYASQWMAPVLLILAHSRAASGRLLPVAARLAVAATFIGHGLYAVGIHPVPGHFVDMFILHTGVREATALKLLFAMGVLDFAVAAGMLLPARPAMFFLAYAAVWGALTALARVAGGFDAGLPAFGAMDFLPRLLYRVPHAGLPLCLLARSGAFFPRPFLPRDPAAISGHRVPSS